MPLPDGTGGSGVQELLSFLNVIAFLNGNNAIQVVPWHDNYTKYW